MLGTQESFECDLSDNSDYHCIDPMNGEIAEGETLLGSYESLDGRCLCITAKFVVSRASEILSLYMETQTRLRLLEARVKRLTLKDE